MTDARLTQLIVESDQDATNVEARLSQQIVEADFVDADTEAQLSQLIVEVDVCTAESGCPEDPAPPPPPPPASTAKPDPLGKRLGCGDYRVFIQTVGGGKVEAELLHTGLRFSRRLDGMSEARVELGAEQDAECIPLLGSLDPYTHEIALWRDEEEVWVGVLTEPDYTYESLSLPALDLFFWFKRRVLPTTRGFVGEDLATIAKIYANDALDQDTTPNVTVIATPTGVLGDRAVVSTLYRYAADEIQELARTGLDYTVIGREVRFGGREISTPSLVTLTEDVFEVRSARLAGLALANDIIVLGTSSGSVSSPVVGRATTTSQPLVQQVYSERSILDVSSATVAAETRLDLLEDPPFFITGRLLETAPINFDDLVPGAKVTLSQQVGFRRIDADMRLLGVDVSATAADNGVTESVELTLEPVGTREVA